MDEPGFFEGVCPPSNATANSYDPPHPAVREIGRASPGITT